MPPLEFIDDVAVFDWGEDPNIACLKYDFGFVGEGEDEEDAAGSGFSRR